MELIEVEHRAGVTVVAPAVPRLDATIAPAFRQAVVDRVERGERRLVLDLGRVEFMDSSGLGALVSILKAAGSQGAMALCQARGSVQGLLTLTRMDRVFRIVPTRDEAVALMAAAPTGP